jgi:hypothetical protein
MITLSSISNAKNMALLLAAGMFLTCGIFSPRDSQQPLPAGRTDPLNFSRIMDSTGYQFAKLQYEDLFNENVTYTDINSSISYKTQLIQKLLLIQRQNPDIQVKWMTGIIFRKPNDTIYLNGLKYAIFIAGDTTAAPDDSGTSDFTVVRENADWHIFMWRDYPARQGRSFFSPP